MKNLAPSSKERIELILQAINKIQQYTESQTFETFLKDPKTVEACLFNYTIIGEASLLIDKSILDKIDYPWYKVKAFRNFILHEYHAIKMDVIWDTTVVVIPEPKLVILALKSL
jgi:uncharacterized protein with HEPN domain